MATGPKEIIEEAKKNRENVIEEVRAKIEETLQKAKRSKDSNSVKSITVDVTGLLISEEDKRLIEQEYLDAGWKHAKFDIDHDRGETNDWFVLKP